MLRQAEQKFCEVEAQWELGFDSHLMDAQLGFLSEGRPHSHLMDLVWLRSAPAGIFTVRGNCARCDSARGGRQSVGRRASRHKYLQRGNEMVKTASWADKASGARPRDARDRANFNEQIKKESRARQSLGRKASRRL